MAKKPLDRPLRTERDYENALAEIEGYFDREPRRPSAAADRFDLLALLIGDYENRIWPVDAPDAVDAIRFAMEIGGHSRADLGRLLGSRQRASDILSGKRRISLAMAWRLHREWGVPAEALIRPVDAPASRHAAE
ncbi:MAG: XRE family transcriptional regulator [Bauldia sp.]|nr:XRE family transcriptional regulator [Bauldia sp.]